MAANPLPNENLKQVVPFLLVTDLERSVRFYTDGLGFVMKNQWVPDGKLRWCWLRRGGAALMLQEFAKSGPNAPNPEDKLGQGVSLAFQCEDAVALYREFRSRGIEAKEPFVGNNMWVTVLCDPDGYVLDFESPTDVPEETTLSEVEASGKS
jgi:catechol 2,3-dioxygenase-like lactoylglutathione lyase family enzyme